MECFTLNVSLTSFNLSLQAVKAHVPMIRFRKGGTGPVTKSTQGECCINCISVVSIYPLEMRDKGMHSIIDQ